MGAAPSHECKTFFSYFRGSYEVGLVPLSKQYFGNASYPSTEMPYEKRAVLREQIVLMRKDPAVLYANSRAGDNMRASMSPTPEEKELEKLLYDFYWDTMPQPDFTEDDLDQFLDLVDRYMYDTDRDMAEDSRYNGTAATSDTTTHKVPFFMPIPCVLCLAYPEGKERQGCFELSGRNINIIGFFGLMTREMEKAFKLVKFDREREIRWTPTTAETDTTVYLQGETTGDPGSSLPKGKEQLFMSTTILTSAGDRTLERVLVLAAVMLRHQYHVACRKYGILKKTQAALTSQGTRLVPEETLMNIEGHLPHIVKASALPPLPAESFVPHPYNFMNEKAAYPPPHLRLLPAQSSLRMSMDNLAQLAVESKDSTLFSYLDSIISGAEPAATAVANTSTNFICYTPALPYAFCLTNEEENAISWGLLHRLDTLGIVIETAANNYCSLKALAENFAFLHCQVLIDPSLSHVAFTDLPVNTVTPQEEADRYNGKHVVLSPSSAIVISLQPKYVRQATLWAASLFHRPTALQGGEWIQFKLKDENDDLRQVLQSKDSLIALWRQKDAERAANYLGEHTSRLLAHVRTLQVETERARGLPLEHWKSTSVFVNSDGRKYAVHASQYGTLLVGVRSCTAEKEGAGKGDEAAKKGTGSASASPKPPLPGRGGNMSKKNSLGNRMDDFHMGNRHNLSGNNVHHMNPANNLNFNMNGFTNMGGMPMPFIPELHNPAMNPFLSMNPNGNYIFNPMMQPFLPGSTNVLPQTRMQVPHTTSSTTNTFSGLYPHAAPFVPSSAKGPNSSPLPMHGAKPSEEGTIFAGGGIAATPTEGGIASPFTSADSLWAFNNNNNNPPTNNSYSNNNNNAMHRGPSNIVNVPPEVHKVPPQSDPAIINFFPEMQTTSINVFRHGNGLYTALNGVPVQISLNPLPVQSMPSGGGTATSSSGRHSPHSSVPSTPSSHHQSMPPSFQKSTPDDGVNLGMFVFQP